MNVATLLALFVCFLGVRLEPGHIVSIESDRASVLCAERTIGNDGNIALPGLGVVAAAGLELTDLELAIRSRAKSHGLQVGSLSLRIAGFDKPIVFFGGSVERAGEVRWEPGLTLATVAMIARPTTGAVAQVTDFRGRVDSATPESLLKPGDHVTFEAISPRTKVLVLGAVRQPGEYEFHSALTVKSAIEQAGGLTPHADDQSITLKRDGKSLTPALAQALRPGDILTIPLKDIRLWITVNGAVSRPGRIALVDGMTLLQALEAVGWPLYNALDEIEIRRDSRTLKFSYKNVKEGKVKDPALNPSDVIQVRFKVGKVS